MMMNYRKQWLECDTVSLLAGAQPASKSQVGKSSTFLIFPQNFHCFFLFLPQNFLILVLILALWVGEPPPGRPWLYHFLLAKAMIFPHFGYCSPLLSKFNAKPHNSLQILHKTCSCASPCRHQDFIDKTMEELNWVTNSNYCLWHL